MIDSTPEIIEATKNYPSLDSEDVSQAVFYVLATWPHVQVTQNWLALEFKLHFYFHIFQIDRYTNSLSNLWES